MNFFLALTKPSSQTLIPGPQNPWHEQDRLFCHTGPNWLEITLPGFQEVLGRHITGSALISLLWTVTRHNQTQGLFHILVGFISTKFVHMNQCLKAKSCIWYWALVPDQPSVTLGNENESRCSRSSLAFLSPDFFFCRLAHSFDHRHWD